MLTSRLFLRNIPPTTKSSMARGLMFAGRWNKRCQFLHRQSGNGHDILWFDLVNKLGREPIRIEFDCLIICNDIFWLLRLEGLRRKTMKLWQSRERNHKRWQRELHPWPTVNKTHLFQMHASTIQMTSKLQAEWEVSVLSLYIIIQ